MVFLIFTPNVASFAVVISLESLFEYPNPGLTGIILGMSLGNPFGSLSTQFIRSIFVLVQNLFCKIKYDTPQPF